MARTKKGSKGPTYEYWGKRSALSGLRDPGRFTKVQTHRAERRRDRKLERDDGS